MKIFGVQFILAPLAQMYDCAKLNCALKFKDKKIKVQPEILMMKLSFLYYFQRHTSQLFPVSLENTNYTSPSLPLGVLGKSVESLMDSHSSVASLFGSFLGQETVPFPFFYVLENGHDCTCT
jgi:hypothetical protein